MSNNKSDSSHIRQVFGQLDDQTLQIVHSMTKRCFYPAQTILCQQGEIGHTFYIIIEGNVSTTQLTKTGEERLLGIMGPGGYFGEMSLLDAAPRMATCTAITDVIVLEITEDGFNQIVAQNPTAAYVVTRTILENARRMDKIAITELTEVNWELKKAYAELQRAQIALVEKERLERESELAAEVQYSLLPEELPQFSDFAFKAYLQMAYQAGGDFFDVQSLDDNHVAILVADVADKGMHAAMVMAVTRTLFWQASRVSLSPVDVVLMVHEGLLEVLQGTDTFVTAFYGVLHRPSMELVYVRAAHERPLWYRRHQQIVEPLLGNGRFLGMIPQFSLTEHRITLQPGDRLVLFSDGLVDAQNEAGKAYGHTRLEQLIAQNGHLSAHILLNTIVDDNNLWVGDTGSYDDLTLMVIEAKTTH